VTSVFLNFLKRGHERSIRIKKNAILSFFLTSGGIVIAFVRVPILLDYLGATQYGIWLVLVSTISWFRFFNMGLGSGLRNKLSESLANDDFEKARVYVTTTYFVLATIITIIYTAFLAVYPFVNWRAIFNAPDSLSNEIGVVVFIFATAYCIEIIFNLISSIFEADQKPSLTNLRGFLTNILFLIFLLLLKYFVPSSLVFTSILFYFSSICIFFIFYVYFFWRRYSFLRPSFRYFRIDCIRELTSLGLKFFVLQITAIILYSTDNMIVTQVSGPNEVSVYHIANKYMSIGFMGFTIIAEPLWSAFTDAFTRNDIRWIKWVMKKTLMVWIGIFTLCCFQFVFSDFFFGIWVGDRIQVPHLLTFLMGVFTIVRCWNLPFVYFLNGVGTIKLQLYIGIFIICLNIPLSLFFAIYTGLGPNGVILGTVLCILISSLVSPIQYRKIINNKAKGIWGQ